VKNYVLASAKDEGFVGARNGIVREVATADSLVAAAPRADRPPIFAKASMGKQNKIKYPLTVA
jgi:hypothetical protein